MSETLTAADQIRADAANAVETLSFYNTVNSDGTNASLSGSFTLGTYVDIATVTGTTPDTDLFVPAGAIYIENHDDTSPVIDSATPVVDTTPGATDNVLVYQGDAAGQTFFAGDGQQDAIFTGYGNTFAAGSATGTYVVVAGLQSAATSNTTLAAAPTTTEGNVIAISAGTASVAAGLGDNSIFLGSGNSYVANEGNDTIYAGSGSTTVDGAGQSQIFGGQGDLTFYGDGGSATITLADSTSGGTLSTAGTASIYGDTGAVTVYGGASSLVAYGGTGGSNVLVAGAGNATLVGAGGSNELAAGTGTGSTELVASASGNDTLFGGTGGGTTNVFLGGGSDTLVGGTTGGFIEFGTGSAAVFENAGSNVYGLNGAATYTGTDVVSGFNASTDSIQLQNFGSVTGSDIVAQDITTSGGNTFLNDTSIGLNIEFLNTTSITASNFTT